MNMWHKNRDGEANFATGWANFARISAFRDHTATFGKTFAKVWHPPSGRKGRDWGRAKGGRETYHAEEVPRTTIEKRRSKVPTVVAEQELDIDHLGVALFGLVDGLRTDAGKAKGEF